MYYVYSLNCKDGYYVGCTDNVEDNAITHAYVFHHDLAGEMVHSHPDVIKQAHGECV